MVTQVWPFLQGREEQELNIDPHVAPVQPAIQCLYYHRGVLQ